VQVLWRTVTAHAPATAKITGSDVYQSRQSSIHDRELNWPLSFALDHRNPFAKAIIFDQIAATQFAINPHVEKHQITKIAREFEPRVDGPNLFEKQWAFLADNPPLVPGFALWGDCRRLNASSRKALVRNVSEGALGRFEPRV